LGNTDYIEVEDKFPISFTEVQGFIHLIKKSSSGREKENNRDVKIIQL